MASKTHTGYPDAILDPNTGYLGTMLDLRFIRCYNGSLQGFRTYTGYPDAVLIFVRLL